jgi:hypothetical protein
VEAVITQSLASEIKFLQIFSTGVANQRTLVQAEERGVEETGDCDGCVVDHWHYLVDDSPECLSQLQARIGDQPAALVGRPESDKQSTVFSYSLFAFSST